MKLNGFGILALVLLFALDGHSQSRRNRRSPRSYPAFETIECTRSQNKDGFRLRLENRGNSPLGYFAEYSYEQNGNREVETGFANNFRSFANRRRFRLNNLGSFLDIDLFPDRRMRFGWSYRSMITLYRYNNGRMLRDLICRRVF